MEKIILFENYKGTYKIKEVQGEKYIVSDEKYGCGTEGYLSKSNISFSSKDKCLLLSLANCNNDEEKILAFCNTYGLPVSSALIRDMCAGKEIILGVDCYVKIESVDSDDKEDGGDGDNKEAILEHYDYMLLSEFMSCVSFARDLLYLHSICITDFRKKSHRKYSNSLEQQDEFRALFSSIYNLLLFCYIDLGLCTFESDNLRSDIYSLQCELWKFMFSSKSAEITLNSFIRFLIEPHIMIKDPNIVQLIIILIESISDSLIKSYEEGMGKGNTIIDFNNLKVISESLTTEAKYWNTIRECGASVFEQIIEDFVNCSRIKLAYDDNRKRHYVKLNSSNLFSASIVELYHMITSGIEIRRCANLNCGRFFFPSRSTQVYCNDNCRITNEMKRRKIKKRTESSSDN